MSDQTPLEPQRHRTDAPARSLGLDALRGLAILLMCLAAYTPAGLPNWMHHGNFPQFIPDPVAAENGEIVLQAVTDRSAVDPAWIGMSWVDVVFPMFLFAMGAAIPLALAGRMRRTPSRLRLARSVLSRFFLLVGFSIYVQQTVPWRIESAMSASTWVFGLLAFVVLFPLLMRLPAGTPPAAARTVRGVGWIGAVLVLLTIHLRPGHAGFSWATHDIIILLLAWSGLVAALLWLATPGRPGLRYSVGFAIAFLAHQVNLPAEHRLPPAGLWAWVSETANAPGRWLDGGGLVPEAAQIAGQVPAWADLSPLYGFGMWACLWLVLPGMIVGDLLRKRLTTKPINETDTPSTSRPTLRWGVVIGLACLAWVAAFAGLQDMYQDWELPGGAVMRNPAPAWLAVPLLIGVAAMVWRDHRAATEEALIGRLFFAAAACGVAGVLLSVIPGPAGGYFEGGPRKVPGTFSWYALSTGCSLTVLAVFMLVIDRWGWRRRAGLLIHAGQNPMLAYMAARNVLTALTILPLLTWLYGSPQSLDGWVFGGLTRGLGEGYSPWWVFAYGGLKVLMLATVVACLNYCRIAWRA